MLLISNPYYGARWVYDTGGVLNSTMLDIATDMGYLYPFGPTSCDRDSTDGGNATCYTFPPAREVIRGGYEDYKFVIRSGNEAVCPQRKYDPVLLVISMAIIIFSHHHVISHIV